MPHSTKVGILVNRSCGSFRNKQFESFQLNKMQSHHLFILLPIYLARSPTEHSINIPFDGNDDSTVSSTGLIIVILYGHL